MMLATTGGTGARNLLLFLKDHVKNGTDQCCKAAEDNVRQDCTSKYVSDEASYKQSRDCSRSKYREDRQCFRKTDLHLSKSQ